MENTLVLQALYISLFVQSVSGLALSVYIIFTVKRFGGGPLWTFGILCLMIGTLLIGLRDTVPDLLSIHFANLILVFVPVCIAHSLRRFMDDKTTPQAAYGSGALLYLLFLFTLYFGEVRHRVMAIALAYAVLWLFPAWQILFAHRGRPASFHRPRNNSILALMFATISLLSWARLVFTALEDGGETKFLSMQGFQVVYLISASALWFGALTGYILLINGRLEYELREESQRLKEANKTKNKFFGIIAHDLRGTAGALINSLEFLNDDLRAGQTNSNSDPAHYLQMSGIAERQSRLLNDTLNNLLTWARSQQDMILYEPMKINVPEIIESEIRFLKQQISEKNIQVQLQPEGQQDMLKAFADLNSIHALFRNLLSNAVKYSHNDGIISLHVSLEDAGQILQTKITDNGIGIGADRLRDIRANHKVTSVPGTRKEVGTGLGLSLCYDYIRGNQGSLTIESELAQGTEVTVRLPATER